MRDWVHIIGGGAAGLSLAEQLCNIGDLPGKIILSDPDITKIKDKSFGYWYTEKEKHILTPNYSWERWSFSTKEKQFCHKGNKYFYGLSTGEQIFEKIFEKIENHPRVEIRAEKITCAPSADYVFDSRPIPKNDFWIKQTFVGWVLTCEDRHPFRDAQLMCDMQANSDGLNFRYLLPINNKQLLVEYTDFSQSMERFHFLENQVKVWCETNIKSKYRVDRVESACIPMGYNRQREHFGIPIGVRGGLARSSTGYSFRASHYWARDISSRLKSNKPIKEYHCSYKQDWMDNRLLWLIENWPQCLPSIFLAMGERLSGDRFARFMTKTDIFTALSVISAVPKFPFLISSLKSISWKR
tara:strand:- start:789 stop:1853 length:1065 start_codon:yes stop_codon:yes gene_type:complete